LKSHCNQTKEIMAIFFDNPPPFPASLKTIAAMIGVDCQNESQIIGLASLSNARPNQISFFDSAKYSESLKTSIAGACLISEKLLPHLPAHIIPLVVKNPQGSFVELTRKLYPEFLIPKAFYAENDDYDDVIIHEDAEIEHNVTIDPGVIIAKNVIIGSGTHIGGGTVIGENVTIGRDCSIAPNVTLQHCHIGNRVILHPGVRVGQDGFGFRHINGKHQKIPQIARVIIQDDVEIGANTTVDRGSIRDTVIGEGTKIDNLVQIAHNVVVGRHCIIVSFVALAGSCTLEDNVTLAGYVSVNNHLTIGEGAIILATSAVGDNIPKHGRYGGFPAKPVKQWFRELAAIEKLGKASRIKEGHNNE
jgi:UDP-3-O-[3-hydroxymyristoyl] glucosamine N-acyltransferase